MHEPEHTIARMVSDLSDKGSAYGVPREFPWAAIIDIILQLLKDCGKEAAKKTPLLARIRLTSRLRAAMPGSTLREVVAVRETVMASALAASDDDYEAVGEISL